MPASLSRGVPWNQRACTALPPLNRPLAEQEVFEMLGWIITFLVIALIAGVLGFGGIAGAATTIAQVLFFIFLIALVVSLVMHMRRA